MFEIAHRAGLARQGRLRGDGVDLITPTALFWRGQGVPKPSWAEGYLGFRKARDTVRVDRPGGGHAPPLLSRPLSLAEVTFPGQEEEGDIAFLSDPEAATETSKDILALQNTPEYLRYPRKLVQALIALRKAGGYQRALYTPLIATPANAAVLSYTGVDLVDALRVGYDTDRGRFHTPEGTLSIEELEEWPCLCRGCERRNLLAHNLRTLVGEVRKVRTAIHQGTIRELVEQRVSNDPWSTAVLRELDYRQFPWQERHVPVSGPPLRAYSPESLHRPEVVRFRQRLADRYRRPPSAQVLLLLPCSARKPYSASKSHRQFRSAIRQSGNPATIHVVVVTSPLGLVPEELELFYPAQHYDVPVTGDWSQDEATMLQESMAAYLKRNPYEAIVVHLGDEAELLEPVLGDTIRTAEGSTRSPEALESLREALHRLTADLPIVPYWQRRAEENVARARFQFGPGGEALLEGSTVRGRYPNLRFLNGGRQVAALHGPRGLFSLTLFGGERLVERDLYWVEIDDFYPEGNVFAVGVLDADPEIRVGDDVVVRHGEEVRAVGVAKMPPEEMITSARGEAVHVRHRVRPPEGETG